jgi:hypothetical protein
MSQVDVSRLARICYRILPASLFPNIARMYTQARNNCTVEDDSLLEFVKEELKNYGHTKNPVELLEDCGASL